MERTIPAFPFPAKAGPHLMTPEGWKAELTFNKEYNAECSTFIYSHHRFHKEKKDSTETNLQYLILFAAIWASKG